MARNLALGSWGLSGPKHFADGYRRLLERLVREKHGEVSHNHRELINYAARLEQTARALMTLVDRAIQRSEPKRKKLKPPNSWRKLAHVQTSIEDPVEPVLEPVERGGRQEPVEPPTLGSCSAAMGKVMYWTDQRIRVVRELGIIDPGPVGGGGGEGDPFAVLAAEREAASREVPGEDDPAVEVDL